MPSMIEEQDGGDKFLGGNSKLDIPISEALGSIKTEMDPNLPPDEYENDDDPGFDTYLVNEENFVAHCKQLAREFDFPKRAIGLDTKEQKLERDRLRAL